MKFFIIYGKIFNILNLDFSLSVRTFGDISLFIVYFIKFFIIFPGFQIKKNLTKINILYEMI